MKNRTIARDQAPIEAAHDAKTSYTALDTHVDAVDARSIGKRMLQSRLAGSNVARVVAGVVVAGLCITSGIHQSRLRRGERARQTQALIVDEFTDEVTRRIEDSGYPRNFVEGAEGKSKEDKLVRVGDALQKGILTRDGLYRELMIDLNVGYHFNGAQGGVTLAITDQVALKPDAPFRLIGTKQASLPAVEALVNGRRHWLRCTTGSQILSSIKLDIGGPNKATPQKSLLQAEKERALLVDVVFAKRRGFQVEAAATYDARNQAKFGVGCTSKRDDRVVGGRIWYPTVAEATNLTYRIDENGKVYL